MHIGLRIGVRLSLVTKTEMNNRPGFIGYRDYLRYRAGQLKATRPAPAAGSEPLREPVPATDAGLCDAAALSAPVLRPENRAETEEVSLELFPAEPVSFEDWLAGDGKIGSDRFVSITMEEARQLLNEAAGLKLRPIEAKVDEPLPAAAPVAERPSPESSQVAVRPHAADPTTPTTTVRPPAKTERPPTTTVRLSAKRRCSSSVKPQTSEDARPPTDEANRKVNSNEAITTPFDRRTGLLVAGMALCAVAIVILLAIFL